VLLNGYNQCPTAEKTPLHTYNQSMTVVASGLHHRNSEDVESFIHALYLHSKKFWCFLLQGNPFTFQSQTKVLEK